MCLFVISTALGVLCGLLGTAHGAPKSLTTTDLHANRDAEYRDLRRLFPPTNTTDADLPRIISDATRVLTNAYLDLTLHPDLLYQSVTALKAILDFQDELSWARLDSEDAKNFKKALLSIGLIGRYESAISSRSERLSTNRLLDSVTPASGSTVNLLKRRKVHHDLQRELDDVLLC